MNDIQCLSHTRWDCKFHVVWIPKCRRKILYGQLRKNLGDVFHDLARQKESRIVEGHLQPDHVHMLLSIPPKYSVAQVVGYMKGKSAIYIARNYLGQKRTTMGCTFGHGAILCQPLVPTRQWFAHISVTRSKRISESNNWTCLNRRPPYGGQIIF
jgi:Transposase and inactivated derivatives